MTNQKLVFKFDIHDYENIDRLMEVIKKIVSLSEDEGFISMIKNGLDQPKSIDKKNITINIYKESDDTLPF